MFMPATRIDFLKLSFFYFERERERERDLFVPLFFILRAVHKQPFVSPRAATVFGAQHSFDLGVEQLDKQTLERDSS